MHRGSVPTYAIGLLVAVFVFIDLAAGAILFPVELVLLGLSQVAIVCGHVSLFLVLDMLFLSLDVSSLPRRHRTVLHSIGNAVLLVLLAGVDFVDPRMARVVLAGASLCSGCSDRNETAHCED